MELQLTEEETKKIVENYMKTKNMLKNIIKNINKQTKKKSRFII